MRNVPIAVRDKLYMASLPEIFYIWVNEFEQIPLPPGRDGRPQEPQMNKLDV